MDVPNTVTRCDRTELPIEMCAHCRGLPDVPPDADPGADIFSDPAGNGHPSRIPGPWFEARFPGECSSCGRDLERGESIRGDGQGGYEGECCR